MIGSSSASRGVFPKARRSNSSNGLLARTRRLGQAEYFPFHSWYVELIVRTQTATLGISDPSRPRINPEELMPEVLALNLEAYRLIHHIENTVRNFVVLYLRSQQPDDEFLLQPISNPRSARIPMRRGRA